MSVKSAPYYWLECDGCGAKSTEGSEHAAWAGESQAIDEASESGWLVKGDRHLCEDCSDHLKCPECGEERPTSDAICADPECQTAGADIGSGPV